MNKNETQVTENENLTKGFFAEPESNHAQESAPIPTPVPVPKPVTDMNENYQPQNKEDSFDENDILRLIQSENEDGYSPSLINVTLQKLHNVTADTNIFNMPEDDIEFVEGAEIENCKVQIYNINDNIVNIELEFDSVNDGFLKELMLLMSRYRVVQENVQTNTDEFIIPLFDLTFMPTELNGKGILKALSPIAYFRTLNDNNINCKMHFLFDLENIIVSKIELSEEEDIQINAEVLREIESSNNGQLFAEDE